MGALNYNLKKLYHPDQKLRAELLDTNFTSTDPRQIQKEVEWLQSLRPNLSRYVYHTSINFAKEDLLDNKKLLAIAHNYLSESGYNNNQYLIFRHHDADHPHIHLLVNRIDFDGNVVSDSNNYKKSEAILRKLEYQYSLVTVEQSNHRSKEQRNDVSITQGSFRSKEHPISRTKQQGNHLSQRAGTKSEIEKAVRTGKPSDKMLLQEFMKGLFRQQNVTIQGMIRQGEKIALGNSFKWAELIKRVDYEQSRDSAAISAANISTKAIYGEPPAAGYEQRSKGLPENLVSDTSIVAGQPPSLNGGGEETIEIRTDESKANEGHLDTGHTGIDMDIDQHHKGGIQISDDIDDEAILGRNRRKQKQARTNRR